MSNMSDLDTLLREGSTSVCGVTTNTIIENLVASINASFFLEEAVKATIGKADERSLYNYRLGIWVGAIGLAKDLGVYSKEEADNIMEVLCGYSEQGGAEQTPQDE